MPKVTYIDSSGNERAVQASAGTTVMEAAIDNDVDGIVAACGGSCSCCTCHVYITPEWRERVGGPHSAEVDTLEFGVDVRAESRLSCQIELTDELDGLVVHVPDEQAG